MVVGLRNQSPNRCVQEDDQKNPKNLIINSFGFFRKLIVFLPIILIIDCSGCPTNRGRKNMANSMFYYLIFSVLGLVILSTRAEIADSGDQNKQQFKVLEKDLEDAKERWMEMEDWGDDDMMQHPIDEGPRRTHRELGEMCTYSRDCRSGCCQLDRDTKLRSCQPKAEYGEKCTNAQVKADTYVDACPCVSGYDYCTYPKEVCTK